VKCVVILIVNVSTFLIVIIAIVIVVYHDFNIKGHNSNNNYIQLSSLKIL